MDIFNQESTKMLDIGRTLDTNILKLTPQNAELGEMSPHNDGGDTKSPSTLTIWLSTYVLRHRSLEIMQKQRYGTSFHSSS